MRTFFYRLKFYIFGLLLGILAVSFLFKGRGGCKTPGTLKREELFTQTLQYTEHAKCRMKCRDIKEAELKFILEEGSVNYKKSQVHDKPCPVYAVEGTTPENREIRIVCADCDTITRIVTAIDLGVEKDTCYCK